jgi:hypothetical protein
VTTAAVVSAIYGRYDTVKPVLLQSVGDVDWVLVTDDTDTALDAQDRGWRAVLDPRPELHPNRAAKRAKFEPWRYTGAGASVWIDGSYRVTSPEFVAGALALADPIAQFVHPWRDCVFDEANASVVLAKYTGQPVVSQAAHYRAAGHPEHWGLWAAGVIARQHTPEIRYLGEKWTDETRQWSFQDQISQPYALRLSGLRPAALPGTHLINPWLKYEGSARHG